jgi:hypothetical protein
MSFLGGALYHWMSKFINVTIFFQTFYSRLEARTEACSTQDPNDPTWKVFISQAYMRSDVEGLHIAYRRRTCDPTWKVFISHIAGVHAIRRGRSSYRRRISQAYMRSDVEGLHIAYRRRTCDPTWKVFISQAYMRSDVEGLHIAGVHLT